MTTSAAQDPPSESLAHEFSQFVEFAGRNPELVIQLATEMTERVEKQEKFRESEKYVELLTELAGRLLSPAKLEVGRLAYWKPGLKNKRRPAYGEPAFVVSLYAQPEFNTSSAPGSASFREPLDLVIGVVDDDEELLLYHADSRRFTPTLPGA